MLGPCFCLLIIKCCKYVTIKSIQNSAEEVSILHLDGNTTCQALRNFMSNKIILDTNLAEYVRQMISLSVC